MTPRELEALIAEAGSADVLRAMRGLSEQQRRPLAATALRLAQKYARAENAAMAAQWTNLLRLDESAKASAQALRERHDAACAAMLAACSPTDLARHDRALWDRERAFGVLADRRPPWLRGWAEKALAKDLNRWGLCHRLVMAGLCDRPTSESWCLGFLAHHASKGAAASRTDATNPEVHLGDPAFAGGELWRLFAIEGNSELSFANVDRWGGDAWSKALVASSRQARGGVPRDRLLDATLEALQRDFIQYRARWFADLHRALEPTPAERAERLDRYLTLLGSRIPPTVTFALEQLQQIERDGVVPAAGLMARLAPAAQARAKKTALAALAMAERAAARQPAVAGKAAAVAAAALAHDAADVQARAIALVTSLGDPSDAAFVASVRAQAGATAATVRSKLLAWLGPDATATATAGARSTVAVAATASAPMPAPPAPAPRRAAALDDAIDLLSGAIERYQSPDEMEAALDGVSRFCGERPPDFAARVAPLAKRAAALAERTHRLPFQGYDLRGDLCRLALAWGKARPPEPASSERNLRAFLAGRVREVAARAADARAATLLATPTHEHGWIDPGALVARASGLSGPPDPLDAVQSLLRIARDGRPGALARARDVAGQYGAALRFALGGPRPARAPDDDLWLAAEAGRTSNNLLPRFDLLRYPILLQSSDEDRAHTVLETLVMRWVVTVFPADLRSFFGAGALAITFNLDWNQAMWWQVTFLEPLLRADVPLARDACRLLAAALAAKNAAEGGLATDALIRAVDDGRADAGALGDSFAALLGASVAPFRSAEENFEALSAGKLLATHIKCARWAKRLQEVARASPRHGTFVHELVERGLRGLPAPPPGDLGPLLALLRELSIETGAPLRDPEARARLAALGGGGAAARLARALLTR